VKPLALLLSLVVLAAAGCGEDDPSAAGPAPYATATPAATGSPPSVSRDIDEKPTISRPEGEPPTELVSRDIVRGDGRTARSGDTVSVQYVGIAWSTGEQFDASWDRGEPFEFPLGGGQVIPGWDRGVEGMRVGGRRELVIPADLAYGPAGQGPIGPNETLVFVVDLVGVKRS
jgi:peptidylprolyl isomerase